MSLVGKRFIKRTEIEIVAESPHQIEYQNVNNESENLTMTKEAFEANYVEVVNDGGDMAVSNTDETKTKEETK